MSNYGRIFVYQTEELTDDNGIILSAKNERASISPIQPFKDMWKDVRNTIEPYKSSLHIVRDALQLFRGLWNVLSGSLLAAVGAIAFVGGVVLSVLVLPFLACFAKKGSVAKYLSMVAVVGELFLAGIARTIRGALQIVTVPLTLLLRMPLRVGITKLLWRGYPELQENLGMQRLAKEIQEELSHLDLQNIEPDCVKNVGSQVAHLLTKWSKESYKNEQASSAEVDTWIDKNVGAIDERKSVAYTNSLKPPPVRCFKSCISQTRVTNPGNGGAASPEYSHNYYFFNSNLNQEDTTAAAKAMKEALPNLLSNFGFKLN